MKRKSLILMMLLALGAPWAAQAQFTGNGTESNPYQISSQNDWHTLATTVNNGNSYSGKFFKLTQNISVTEMVGGNATDNNNEGRPFSGTFDGDGYTLTFTYSTNQECCAPFRSASGATFKNLRVDGSITTSAQYAGGIVGIGRGSTDGITFTNCVSNITITSTFNGDSTHGGFAAILFDGTQHFTGCVFTGSFNGTNSTSWAGFVGYSHTWGSCYGSAYEKCVFAPTSIQASVPSSCAAFDRNSSGCTYTNCYYTTDYGTNNGTKVYSVTGESPVNVAMRGSATNTYELNNSSCSLKFYSAGLTLTKNGTTTVYGASGSTLSLTLSGASTYRADYGTLTGSGSDWTLVMPSKNVVISEAQGGGDSDCAEIGTGTGTTGYAPIYGNYKSSYAQMIYTASQLQDAGITQGSIIKIGFNSSASNSLSRKPIIYMGTTSKSSFSSNTDFIDINSLTKVYDYNNHSQWNITQGWNEFELDTPFEYDGTSNLVIALHCGLISDYKSSNFYYTSTTNNQVVYAYNDNTDPVPATYNNNWSNYSGSKSTTTYLPNVRLCIEVPTTETCEDFEGDLGNWTVTSDNSSYQWARKAGTGNSNYSSAGEGSYNVGAYTSSHINKYTYLSYNTDLSSFTNIKVSFKYINPSWSGDIDKIYLQYSTDGTNYTDKVSYTNGASSWTQVDDVEIPDGTKYIRFAAWGDYGYGAGLDEICLDYTESSTPTYITEIASVADWNEFCANVNGGHDYSGETVTMTDNVGTVSTMCGTESNPFRGTFDGQGNTLTVNISSSNAGAAPFHYISNATIENLKVAGTVSSSANHGGGLVGFAWDGTNHIENCLVSTTVTGAAGYGLCGGIIGHGRSATNYITGCVFNGTIDVSNNDTQRGIGGLLGWSDSSTLYIENSLFAGTKTSNGTQRFHPMGCKDGSKTTTGSITNSYYITDVTILGDSDSYSITSSTTLNGKGKYAYTITGQTPVTVANAGTATNYSVSGITSYGTGINFTNNGVTIIYAGNNDNITLNLGYTGEGTVNQYTHNGIAFTDNSNPYSLTMPNENVVIAANISFTKEIEAYGTSVKGGYYLIASPLAAAIAPTDVDDMITDNYGSTATTSDGTYDLYSFNQARELEWQNYRASSFNLVNGQGYLYASKNGTTLTFSGAPYSGDTKTVTLSKTEAATGLDFPAWNLVGNPFAVDDAYITKSFYTLENSDAYTINTASTAIHPMQGLFVVAESDNESLTFSKTPNREVASLNMNVSKVATRGVSAGSTNVVDQAIISFTEGQELPKLQFRNGSTKVYLPKDGKEYAIVSAKSMGTMPVNFKAEDNGTYTLDFTTKEVSFNYLHLIDNMTGEDVDLLAGTSTGSATYTFEAKTTDYESRFKLVFATGSSTGSETGNFAFFSNGSFVINNEGNATLQVFDVNGRILKSESINGCANVNVKAAAGVYVLRLVNGNDVKVQKVVVR